MDKWASGQPFSKRDKAMEIAHRNQRLADFRASDGCLARGISGHAITIRWRTNEGSKLPDVVDLVTGFKDVCEGL